MRQNQLKSMSDADLRQMSRTELSELLERILLRFRILDSEDLRRDIVTKSQSLRLESVIESPNLVQNECEVRG